MLFQEIIRRKRDGLALEPAHVQQMVEGITSNEASEGQVAAFAMAVFFNGMTRAEAAALTLAMRDSGDVFEWDLPGPVVDKHSTGGVGDNVSLMLAPIVAAAGGYVPMISGRGLGHTGGTLDKMDTIPGYTTQPDNALFRKVVREVGCAIIGQTANLAPADKRFYGIRDVTATVESVPLITASILSKKLSAGLEGLVMDVKMGNGAFMATIEDAVTLAESITGVAREAGLGCHALITDMNQPLASAAGNALEVANAVDFLAGTTRDARLETVTLALAGEMLAIGGIAETRTSGIDTARRLLESGAAAEVFARMVTALGGPGDFIEDHGKYLARAKMTKPVAAPAAGHVAAIRSRDIGLAVVELGGGRRRADDVINPGVGLTGLLDLGAEVAAGDPLCLIHADSAEAAEAAEARVRAAYRIGAAPDVPDPVLQIID